MIKDYSSAEDDVIDISSLINDYDPLQDAIDDFVKVTSSGNDSIISVDRDGGSATYTEHEVVRLEGISGLSLDDMID